MIQPVHDDAFSAYCSDEPSGLLITLSGSTELDSKQNLTRFLQQVHDDACARNLGEVMVDLRTAAFVNSTCLKVLASWILQPFANTKPPYRITFITTRAHAWQRRSLSALTFLAPNRVSVVGDS
jgi:hypothetical protein